MPQGHSFRLVEGGKLLTLPNFNLNFKAKYLQQYEAGFELIKPAIHPKARTTRPFFEACVVWGKLLTLTIFQPHFTQAKRFQMSTARFETM